MRDASTAIDWPLSIVAGLMLVGLAAGGCDDTEGESVSPEGTSTGSGAATSGASTFRYALADDPETFDTAEMSGATGGRVAFNIFEGLLMPAQTTEGAETSRELVRPGVAEEWDVSDDGETYTFHLRDDAEWSNGEPVTAEDFRFAWKRVLTPGFPADYAQLLYVIENAEKYNAGKLDDFEKVGVETPDPQTVVVHLENPTPYFPELVAFYTFFPQPKDLVREHGDGWTRSKHIVSNGAYQLELYQSQKQIVLTKNDSYWDADDVSIDRAELKIIKDKNAVVNSYKAGNLHWTGTTLPIAQITSLLTHPDYVSEPMLGVYYYRINVSDEESPLSDPKVRRALDLAINRKSIVDKTLNGLYEVSEGFVPGNLSGYSSSAQTTFDVEKARSLLEEAGYPGGEGFPSVSVLYNTDKNHKLVAESIRDMWKNNLGIEVELKNKDWKSYLQDVDALRYEIARAGWIGDYNDPMTFLNMWTTGNGNNDTGWSNEKYDRLLAEARSTNDREKRESILQRAETLLMEKGPVFPIYDYSNNMLLSSEVEGFEPHNRNIHLIQDLSLKN